MRSRKIGNPCSKLKLLESKTLNQKENIFPGKGLFYDIDNSMTLESFWLKYCVGLSF